VSGRAAAQHRVEVEQFIALAQQDDVCVETLTYQDVIMGLLRAGTLEDTTYLNDIAERYL
jgi:hypothetical protein